MIFEVFVKISEKISQINVHQGLNPASSDLGRREKINLNFYFHTFLWCLKRFYEGFKGLYKAFWGITKKFENKNLS